MRPGFNTSDGGATPGVGPAADPGPAYRPPPIFGGGHLGHGEPYIKRDRAVRDLGSDRIEEPRGSGYERPGRGESVATPLSCTPGDKSPGQI